MGSEARHEQVSFLTSIPAPTDVKEGQILITSVYGIIQSRKRKRSEVVMAIDGEVLSILKVLR